jgi:ABC-type uncharacterized transport system substrate-binding protein
MKRREFITLLGLTALGWPLAAAQQQDRMRRIGVLMAHPEGDPEFQDYAGAFREGLRNLGWIEGRNLKFDFRWGALDDAEMRVQSAKELIALQPDLILTQNTPPSASMLQLTRTIPVIFVIVAGPSRTSYSLHPLSSSELVPPKIFDASTFQSSLCRQNSAASRSQRAALHEFPHHVAALADARRPDHWAQSPFRGLRR